VDWCVSKMHKYYDLSSLWFVDSIEYALSLANNDETVESVYAVGGGSIYETAIKHPKCDELILTMVAGDWMNVDKLFPYVDPEVWKKVSSVPICTLMDQEEWDVVYSKKITN